MSWTVQPLEINGPLFEGAISVYREAFARPPYNDRARAAEVKRRILHDHMPREGFAAFVAVHHTGPVIGVTYGHQGRPGQWWHDTVDAELSREAARQWLRDSYELVEVAVEPAYQSLGIGRALIARLLAGRPEATCVLSTRCDSRAHELYRKLGFEEVVKMQFAPSGHWFYIMGKRLRVAPPAR
jgi:ribosomal protein S18 acetylase RimI-like enzyme